MPQAMELGVYAYAAAQVKKAMEVTHYLGGENYVFWGGHEGYQSLLNTDMERELDHMAKFLEAVVNYKKKIGFNGTSLIEPKPQEPTKHQYDWDAATTSNFLRKYGLIGEFKLNIECNHATLSGHSCHHELETARINGILGNVDANTGDPQTCWDTDQFMTDIQEATMVMLSVIKNGGIARGGFNFDAKLLGTSRPRARFGIRTRPIRLWGENDDEETASSSRVEDQDEVVHSADNPSDHRSSGAIENDGQEDGDSPRDEHEPSGDEPGVWG